MLHEENEGTCLTYPYKGREVEIRLLKYKSKWAQYVGEERFQQFQQTLKDIIAPLEA